MSKTSKQKSLHKLSFMLLMYSFINLFFLAIIIRFDCLCPFSYEGEATSRPSSQQQRRPLLSPSLAASSPSPLARYLCHSETNLSQLSAAGAALSLVSAAEAETVTAKVTTG